MRVSSLAAGLSGLASVAIGSVVPAKRATVCNGHAEFCDRSYGNITYVGGESSSVVNHRATTNHRYLLAHDSFTATNDTLNCELRNMYL